MQVTRIIERTRSSRGCKLTLHFSIRILFRQVQQIDGGRNEEMGDSDFHSCDICSWSATPTSRHVRILDQ
eukprot:764417-Hanusia_phi.AAC.7